MELPDRDVAVREDRWTSLWVVALVSLVAQLWLCQFFSFGERVPVSLDINPSNVWKYAYHAPSGGTFQILNWLGVAYPAQPLNPLSVFMAQFSAWLFFTAYVPIISTCALLAMTAFLRELELSRPAALFGGVIFAWQGEILPFVYPGHYGYITSWPFFALAAWGALRCERSGHWAYALVSGASCGIMVGLLTNADRGAIASILIGILYLASIARSFIMVNPGAVAVRRLSHLALCVLAAMIIALAPLLALFQGFVVGSKLAGTSNPAQTYGLVTQFSLGPVETLTYLTPGLFGWHSNSTDGQYWGWIGQWPGWEKSHQGSPNLNLAISTTGTVATGLALIGMLLMLPGGMMGPDHVTTRQRYFGGVLLAAGFVTLILSWGWHTPFYRPLMELPLMDKWRNPLKWLEMTNFALVVLSAFGVEHLLGTIGDVTPGAQVRKKRLTLFAYAGLTSLILGLMATYPIATVLAAVLHKEGYDPYNIANIMSTMHTSVLVSLILAAMACLVMIAAWEPGPLRKLTLVNPWLHRLWQGMLQPENVPVSMSLSLAALAVLQLGWVAGHFLVIAPLADLTESNPLLDALHDEGDRVRVSIDNSDPILNTLLQNQFAAMGISCLEISAASRVQEDFSAYREALANNLVRDYFLAGVKNLVIPQDGMASIQKDAKMSANIAQAGGYTLVPTGSPNLPSHALVEFKDYLAKATLVPRAEFIADEKAMLARLKDPAWNPRETVLLSSKETSPDAAPDADDKVDLLTYTPTTIDLKAHAKAGGFVLLNDRFDPDWQVQLNGHDAELLRADYIMRAVKIPPGDSTIAMHYVGHYRVAGWNLDAAATNLFCDGAMVLAWLVAWLALRRKNSALPG